MAFIQNPEDQQEQFNQGPQAQGQGPLVGGSSNIAGQGTPQAGVGAGGSGWTNIQAYLKANESDTGSAQNLNQKVGSEFDKEKNNLQQDSSSYLNNAKTQAQNQTVSKDQLGQYINQAGDQYQYGQKLDRPQAPDQPMFNGGYVALPGQAQKQHYTTNYAAYNQPDKQTPTNYGNNYDYYDVVGKAKDALTKQYTGPTEYNYAIGDQANKYAQNLQDNGSFDQMMKGLYSERANSPLSAGQYQLQKQFDVNNAALNDTRQNLVGKYGDLTKQRDQTVADTSGQLKGLESDYRKNQNALNDFLYSKANDYEKAQNDAESQARSGFTTDSKGAKSGYGSIGYSDKEINDPEYLAQQNGGMADPFWTNMRKDMGIWGDNLNMDQLQTEMNMENSPNGYGSKGISADPLNPNDVNARAGLLGQFYNDENAKYFDTGDQEKRRYNAIMDFLNSDANRKQGGFLVKGQ